MSLLKWKRKDAYLERVQHHPKADRWVGLGNAAPASAHVESLPLPEQVSAARLPWVVVSPAFEGPSHGCILLLLSSAAWRRMHSA